MYCGECGDGGAFDGGDTDWVEDPWDELGGYFSVGYYGWVSCFVSGMLKSFWFGVDLDVLTSVL